MKLTNTKLATFIMFIGLMACSVASTEHDKLHDDLPRQALQEAISVYDVKAMPIGFYVAGVFNPEKLIITAKARNKTIYTFKKITLIQLALKTGGGSSKTREGNKFVVILSPLELIKDWKPNEEIELQSESDVDPARTKKETARDALHLQAIVKELNLSINQFKPLSAKMEFSVLYAHAKDCFRPDCKYKKLPHSSSKFCGS